MATARVIRVGSWKTLGGHGEMEALRFLTDGHLIETYLKVIQN